LKKKNKTWNKFYELFGIELDIKISDTQNSIVVATGITLRLLSRFLREQANCYEISPHLAEEIVSESKIPKGSYLKLISYSKDYQSDSKAKVFLSAETTLLEGLVFQAKHFFDKGKFANYKEIVCNGSRGFGDKIPIIYFKDKKLQIEFILPKN